MPLVRASILYDGHWDHKSDGTAKYSGEKLKIKGMVLPMNIAFEEFYRRVERMVPHQCGTHEMKFKFMSVHADNMIYAMDVQNKSDLQFVFMEQRYPPQICVEIVEKIDKMAEAEEEKEEEEGEEEDVDGLDAMQDSMGFDVHNRDVMSDFGKQSKFRHPSSFHDAGTSQGPSTSLDPSMSYGPSTSCGPSMSHDPTASWCPSSPRSASGVHESNDVPKSGGWVFPNNDTCGIDDVPFHDDIEKPEGIFEGRMFGTKEELQKIISLHALHNNFEFKAHRSTKRLFHAVCKGANCIWKCRAVQLKEGTCWEVRCWVDEHSCSNALDNRGHRQASSKIIGQICHSDIGS